MSKRPRITFSHSRGEESEVTIGCLTSKELEQVKSMLLGTAWITLPPDDGARLRFIPTLEPPPSPTADEAMLPFWRRATPNERSHMVQLSLPGMENLHNHSPSFMVQSLCGYYYNPEAYRQQAAKLEGWGFECLRSRRGEDGRYSEIWYLPGAWAAKGELQAVIATKKDDVKQTEAVVDFLCKHASFGTLDVAVQRAAMTVD